ncbi:uncharacterized protein LOC110838339 [Zootermopsis nevadensis]|uniref:uncharacterized protein LOC110838339 n=1 Tax=Zootermopsis nevadensis TaxID=136037 RepID=UPI000B8E6CDD|nr:uncharacterized protein LOC110838339 [Zootermopsis nevadensis]
MPFSSLTLNTTTTFHLLSPLTTAISNKPCSDTVILLDHLQTHCVVYCFISVYIKKAEDDAQGQLTRAEETITHSELQAVAVSKITYPSDQPPEQGYNPQKWTEIATPWRVALDKHREKLTWSNG